MVLLYNILIKTTQSRKECRRGKLVYMGHEQKKSWKQKKLILFFIGIVRLCWYWTRGSQLDVPNFSRNIYGLDPRVEGRPSAIAMSGGLLTVGCILGLLLLKIYADSKLRPWKYLQAAANLEFDRRIFGLHQIAVLAFPSWLAFFASVMWSIIFSLALNSVKIITGALIGILCSGIVGRGHSFPYRLGLLAILVVLKEVWFFYT